MQRGSLQPTHTTEQSVSSSSQPSTSKQPNISKQNHLEPNDKNKSNENLENPIIQEFLRNIGAPCHLQEDIKSVTAFMESLQSLAGLHYNFRSALEDFKSMTESQRKWKKETNLEKAIKAANDSVAEAKERLCELDTIRLPAGASALKRYSATYLHKANLIKNTMVQLQLAQKCINEATRLISIRLAMKKKEIDPLRQQKQYKLNCYNDTSLSWEEAFDNGLTSSDFPGPLTGEQIIEAGKIVSSNTSASVAEIAESLGLSGLTMHTLFGIVSNVCQWFPVMSIVRENRGVVIDLHEMLVNEEMLVDVLTIDEEEAEPKVTEQDDQNQSEKPKYHRKGKGRRKPIHEVILPSAYTSSWVKYIAMWAR